MRVQTDEWSVQNAAAVGEELLAERRSRAGERAALEAKIQVCSSILGSKSGSKSVVK
jgi:hypothetical protein